MRLDPLPTELFADWWPLVASYAEQMASRFPDDWPVEETQRQAANGSMVLWLVRDGNERLGVIGTHVHVKPSGKRYLSVSWAAGRDHGKWARMADEVIGAHGRRNGCSAMVIEGRIGWARALEGYRPKRWPILVKEL